MLSRKRPLPAVVLCVFLSGTASLLLEIVWSRLLKLVFGSTTLAITTILVAYMLGLGLGGLLGGRLVERLKNGVRAYGWMEIGVGLYALCVPALLGLYPWINRELLAPLSFWPAAFLRFGFVLLLLLIPTLMMGATLPVLVAAIVRHRDDLSRHVGTLYGINTLGAMSGVLAGTFLFFRLFGVRTTNTIGAGLDLFVGALAVFVLAPAFSEKTVRADRSAEESAGRRWSPQLLIYGGIGFTALLFEICWTRALSMVVGSSVYAFATMLAGFLAGIALGALFARRLFERVRSPLLAYGLGAALLGVMALLTTLSFRELPELFLWCAEHYQLSGARLVWLSIGVSFLIMLGPTLVLGALFPLVVRAAASPGRSSAGTVGDVYFVNTIGAASGAFLTGFVLIPALGLKTTLYVGIALDLVLAAAILFFCRKTVPARVRPIAFAAAAGGLALLLLQPGWKEEELALGVYYRPEGRLDFGLPAVELQGVPTNEMLFYEEGINTTVSIHRAAEGLENGGISLRLNGKTDASLADMSTQILSGHLPLLFGGEAARALVIGYASGVTTGSASLYPLERIDVAEIEPAVIEASHWFDEVNQRPLEREHVHLILDDGRTWLTTTETSYDVIISEPSNPWITGCSNLFTAEFFELVEERLAPGGRLLQWIQLYEMRPEGLESILAALFESFDHAYGFLADSSSTDLLLIATDVPWTAEDLPRWEELPAAVREDLRRVGCGSTADLWSLVVLLPEDCRDFAERAEVVNTDDSMFVELDAPFHLYDDSLEASDAILSAASGIGPLVSALNPEEAPLGELALSYLDLRDFPPLASDLIRVAAAEGDLAHALVYDADRALYGETSDPDAALDMLNRAVALDPEAFAPHAARAWLACQTMRYTEAFEDIDAALRLRPGDLEMRHLRTKALGVLERYDLAWKEIQELLDGPLIERDPHVLAEAAFLAAPLGDFPAAVDLMERYLALMPNSPREWQMVEQLYEHLGDEPAQLRARTNSARARSNQIRDIHRAARWQAHEGSLEEAIETLERLERSGDANEEVWADLERWRAAAAAG